MRNSRCSRESAYLLLLSGAGRLRPTDTTRPDYAHVATDKDWFHESGRLYVLAPALGLFLEKVGSSADFSLFTPPGPGFGPQVLSFDIALNSAARSKLPAHSHCDGLARRHQIAQDSIDRVFVENAQVAIGGNVFL